MNLIYQLVSKNPKVEITPQVLLRIHNESFGWIFPSWAGKFRTVRVEFSGKEAVPPHQVYELIVILCADLKERLKYLNPKSDDFIGKVVDLPAWFQHRFVWIHPFQDYNGRVARMLTILILMILNLPPIEIRAKAKNDRRKYLEAMYTADDGDYSKLESLIERSLNESLAKINLL